MNKWRYFNNDWFDEEAYTNFAQCTGRNPSPSPSRSMLDGNVGNCGNGDNRGGGNVGGPCGQRIPVQQSGYNNRYYQRPQFNRPQLHRGGGTSYPIPSSYNHRFLRRKYDIDLEDVFLPNYEEEPDEECRFLRSRYYQEQDDHVRQFSNERGSYSNLRDIPHWNQRPNNDNYRSSYLGVFKKWSEQRTVKKSNFELDNSSLSTNVNTKLIELKEKEQDQNSITTESSQTHEKTIIELTKVEKDENTKVSDQIQKPPNENISDSTDDEKKCESINCSGDDPLLESISYLFGTSQTKIVQDQNTSTLKLEKETIDYLASSLPTADLEKDRKESVSEIAKAVLLELKRDIKPTEESSIVGMDKEDVKDVVIEDAIVEISDSSPEECIEISDSSSESVDTEEFRDSQLEGNLLISSTCSKNALDESNNKILNRKIQINLLYKKVDQKVSVVNKECETTLPESKVSEDKPEMSKDNMAEENKELSEKVISEDKQPAEENTIEQEVEAMDEITKDKVIDDCKNHSQDTKLISKKTLKVSKKRENSLEPDKSAKIKKRRSEVVSKTTKPALNKTKLSTEPTKKHSSKQIVAKIDKTIIADTTKHDKNKKEKVSKKCNSSAMKLIDLFSDHQIVPKDHKTSKQGKSNSTKEKKSQICPDSSSEKKKEDIFENHADKVLPAKKIGPIRRKTVGSKYKDDPDYHCNININKEVETNTFTNMKFTRLTRSKSDVYAEGYFDELNKLNEKVVDKQNSDDLYPRLKSPIRDEASENSSTVQESAEETNLTDTVPDEKIDNAVVVLEMNSDQEFDFDLMLKNHSTVKLKQMKKRISEELVSISGEKKTKIRKIECASAPLDMIVKKLSKQLTTTRASTKRLLNVNKVQSVNDDKETILKDAPLVKKARKRSSVLKEQPEESRITSVLKEQPEECTKTALSPNSTEQSFNLNKVLQDIDTGFVKKIPDCNYNNFIIKNKKTVSSIDYSRTVPLIKPQTDVSCEKKMVPYLEYIARINTPGKEFRPFDPIGSKETLVKTVSEDANLTKTQKHHAERFAKQKKKINDLFGDNSDDLITPVKASPPKKTKIKKTLNVSPQRTVERKSNLMDMPELDLDDSSEETVIIPNDINIINSIFPTILNAIINSLLSPNEIVLETESSLAKLCSATETIVENRLMSPSRSEVQTYNTAVRKSKYLLPKRHDFNIIEEVLNEAPVEFHTEPVDQCTAAVLIEKPHLISYEDVSIFRVEKGEQVTEPLPDLFKNTNTGISVNYDDNVTDKYDNVKYYNNDEDNNNDDEDNNNDYEIKNNDKDEDDKDEDNDDDKSSNDSADTLIIGTVSQETIEDKPIVSSNLFINDIVISTEEDMIDVKDTKLNFPAFEKRYSSKTIVDVIDMTGLDDNMEEDIRPKIIVPFFTDSINIIYAQEYCKEVLDLIIEYYGLNWFCNHSRRLAKDAFEKHEISMARLNTHMAVFKDKMVYEVVKLFVEYTNSVEVQSFNFNELIQSISEMGKELRNMTMTAELVTMIIEEMFNKYEKEKSVFSNRLYQLSKQINEQNKLEKEKLVEKNNRIAEQLADESRIAQQRIDEQQAEEKRISEQQAAEQYQDVEQLAARERNISENTLNNVPGSSAFTRLQLHTLREQIFKYCRNNDWIRSINNSQSFTSSTDSNHPSLTGQMELRGTNVNKSTLRQARIFSHQNGGNKSDQTNQPSVEKSAYQQYNILPTLSSRIAPTAVNQGVCVHNSQFGSTIQNQAGSATRFFNINQSVPDQCAINQNVPNKSMSNQNLPNLHVPSSNNMQLYQSSNLSTTRTITTINSSQIPTSSNTTTSSLIYPLEIDYAQLRTSQQLNPTLRKLTAPITTQTISVSKTTTVAKKVTRKPRQTSPRTIIAKSPTYQKSPIHQQSSSLESLMVYPKPPTSYLPLQSSHQRLPSSYLPTQSVHQQSPPGTTLIIPMEIPPAAIYQKSPVHLISTKSPIITMVENTSAATYQKSPVHLSTKPPSSSLPSISSVVAAEAAVDLRIPATLESVSTGMLSDRISVELSSVFIPGCATTNTKTNTSNNNNQEKVATKETTAQTTTIAESSRCALPDLAISANVLQTSPARTTLDILPDCKVSQKLEPSIIEISTCEEEDDDVEIIDNIIPRNASVDSGYARDSPKPRYECKCGCKSHLMVCSCLAVVYCSVTCQMEDWSNHKTQHEELSE